MDILVRISTDFDRPSKSVAAGLVPVLRAALKMADASKIYRLLAIDHRGDETRYLTNLFPKIGRVESVEFVPAAEDTEEDGTIELVPADEALRRISAAAGEEEIPRLSSKNSWVGQSCTSTSSFLSGTQLRKS